MNWINKNMMNTLTKKVVLVTGGSRGIGAAITKRLAKDGASVAFTYSRSSESAATLVKDINASGGQALALLANSASPNELTAAIRKTVEEFGPIDILVNNAGIFMVKAFEEHTLEEYDEMMAVNVKAAYVAAQAVLERMPAGGRIITIGSNMADNAMGTQTTLYTMSKSALQGFTRGLARDLGPRKITVNLVQPGPVDTEMNPADADHADYLRSRMALGAYGDGEDIAGLVAFLASNNGKFITGSILTIDGGLNA